jgi:hypothetical protein
VIALELVDHRFAGEDAPHVLAVDVDIFRSHHREYLAADDVGGLPGIHQAQPGRIDLQHRAVLGLQLHALGLRLDDGAQAVFVFLHTEPGLSNSTSL